MMHIPVLLNEVIHYLQMKDSACYLDCTFGAGGYSKVLLGSADCTVYAIDRDDNVLKYAEQLKDAYGNRFYFQNTDFKNLSSTFPNHLFDGIVMDIGVSSMQIDQAERGFSFYNDGPLDMRMDRNQKLDASYIVNNYQEDELAKLIKLYGDERKARRIAKTIVEARKKVYIDSTLALADIVKKATGNYQDAIHPATRTFQALRIAVNDEIEQLRLGLQIAAKRLKIGGRLVVITFHSGEDKVVKEYFALISIKSKKLNKYQEFSLQKAQHETSGDFKLVLRKPISASKDEVRHNIRSRSAKLRVIERLR